MEPEHDDALGDADPWELVLPISEETRRRAAQAVAGLAGQKHPEVPAERLGLARRDRHGWLADRREGNSF
jgi:hypothetical protein